MSAVPRGQGWVESVPRDQSSTLPDGMPAELKWCCHLSVLAVQESKVSQNTGKEEQQPAAFSHHSAESEQHKQQNPFQKSQATFVKSLSSITFFFHAVLIFSYTHKTWNKVNRD
jgi:hypothetical protein